MGTVAGFVMATVAVRFVFPAVSAEGWAFWIIRTSPISMRDFLWSKFWAGLLPVFIMTEALTIAANELLGIDPFLKVVSAAAIIFMSLALVGLATGLGARYPRFGADANQVAGSYGGVAFMILAVLYIIVMIVMLGWPTSIYLFRTFRGNPLRGIDELRIGISFGLVKPRPIVRGTDIVACPTFTLTLNFDRRVMAGAQAARFFKRIIDVLERAETELASS